MTKNIKKLQKGISLIELMIAFALGLFITMGMIGLFVNAKQSYRLNENMSRLQENARFAMSFISRDIRMADYHACVRTGHLDNAVIGVDNSGTYNTDSITLAWQTNDCAVAQAVNTVIYSIKTGATGGTSLFRSVNGVDQELVEGIENMQILYGEDTNNDYTPNYYVDAASITDMTKAVSVRFTLIVHTLETNLTVNGGRITRNFTTTVALRNRLP